MKRKDEYIDNTEFEREIMVYRELGHPESNRLGQLLTDLHLGVLRSMTFSGYPQEAKDEMMRHSMYRILRTKFQSWDRSKGHRAFSYYTRAVVNNYMEWLRADARRNRRQKMQSDEWNALKQEFGLLLV